MPRRIRGVMRTMAVLGGLLLSGASGLAAEGPATAPEGEKVKVTLFVVPADNSADLQAAYIYHLLRSNLQKSRGFAFVDPDDIIGPHKDTEVAHRKVQGLYEEGRKSYDNLELKAAVQMLQQAAAEMEAHLGDLVDRELYTDILTYLGSSYVLLGEQDHGKKAFRKLLLFNKKAELNPMVFPPALTAVFKVVVDETKRSGTGVLDIRPNPAGTEVWVDSVYRGVGSQRVQHLPEGEHFLRLVRRGYVSYGVKREVLDGGEEVIQQELKPLPGYSRLAGLTAQLATDARRSEYPGAADELLRWMGVPRMFMLRVAMAGQDVVLRAFYYDQASKSCLKALENTFNLKDQSFRERLDLFFSSLYMDLGGRAIATSGTGEDDGGNKGGSTAGGTKGTTGGSSGGSNTEDSGSKKWWTTWWFWTAVGVVVAGSTALALGLTLGGGGEPTKGQVIFSF